MKKLAVAAAASLALLAAGAGSANAHPHTVTDTYKDASEFKDNSAYVPVYGTDGKTVIGYRVTVANGAGHPGFIAAPDTDGDGNTLYTSTGFSTYVDHDGKTETTVDDHNSANSGYGMETAHHGPDLGTPGKADDTYVQDGPIGAKSPDDDNLALQ